MKIISALTSLDRRARTLVLDAVLIAVAVYATHVGQVQVATAAITAAVALFLNHRDPGDPPRNAPAP